MTTSRRWGSPVRAGFESGWFCAYCGEPASHVEHVVPWAVHAAWPTMDLPCQLVPACAECNYIAKAHNFDSPIEKRRFIQERLRRRYASVLRMPDWNDEELSELRPRLRAKVEVGLRLKEATLRRVSFPEEGSRDPIDGLLVGAGKPVRPSPLVRELH